ncbi:MAG: hypothetical protein HOI20_15845 [Gemmatimonadetes bacterium]|nr:hypothetical protein [Gemmatimonadota bacterium]MBT5803065.1 hypothetical protein [Gemmatimonadota bacterium]MBT6904621.1 hypothetical protein [Gemmatimonadota bacterium]MBT7417671.1 hypothetical protein [Gemmatimonadota bacterium]MBT7552514.1 hypothetical protein [Gemmatimonadota bacterium]
MRRVLPNAFATHLDSRAQSMGQDGAAGISWRGFWTGAFLSFFLAIGAPYANTAMHSTFMAWDFNTPGAIFLFLVLIGLLNVLFKVAARSRLLALALAVLALSSYVSYYLPQSDIDLLKPGFWFASFLVVSAVLNVGLVLRGSSLALNRADLVLVYIMLLMVSALCSMGMSQQLLPILAAFFYYATPQNKWEEKLHALFPEQTILVDDGQDNSTFFEGVVPGVGDIPYGAWAEPLAWWAVFLIALYVSMISVAVILRRQWMERERLAYPLTQVGLAMVQGEGEGLLNSFFKSRAMWYGCAIPMFFGSLHALNAYDPAMPKVNLLWALPFVGNQVLQLRVSFAMIGFSYLISTNISAGLWFFQLLAKAESEALVVMGIMSKQKFVYGIAGQPYLAYQGGGALIALVLAGLWMGRDHLRAVFRKAFFGADDVNDNDEIASYRASVFGLLISVAVMVGWLWIMGVKLWVAALFIALALLIFIGISRVVAEAGLAAVRSPMIAPDLMIHGLGSNLVGASGVFNLSLSYIWCADIRIFIMALIVNGLKLVEDMDRRSRRMVLWGVYLSIFIGAVGSCWMVLHMAYRHGGINLVGWFFKGGPSTVYNYAVLGLEPAGVAWDGLAFFVGGSAAMLALMWARQHLLWWPLHPLGFAVAANHLMDKIWFSIFIAWAIKGIVLRYGGPASYTASVRFFLGLIMGETLCNGLWVVIDYFTGKTGNIVFILG